LNWAD